MLHDPLVNFGACKLRVLTLHVVIISTLFHVSPGMRAYTETQTKTLSPYNFYSSVSLMSFDAKYLLIYIIG